MAQFGDVETMQEATSSLLVPLQMTVPPDRPFHAEMAAVSVGPALVGKVRATTPGQVCRQPRMIRSSDRRLVKVTVQGRGTAVVTQGGRQARVGPGALVAYDVNQPYEYVSPEPFDLTVVAMPWTMLGPWGDLLAQRTAISVPGDRGIQSVIAAFFNGLADATVAEGRTGGPDAGTAGITGADAIRLADTAAALLITAFTGMPAERAEMPTGLADRILAYTLANLHDPGLSVGSVARRFGISARYLHTLMRGRDLQFTSWVRHERLKRIRRDLADPRLANRTTAAIAARWGIYAPDHLSRSLRTEFGCSAAELRSAARRAAE